MDKKSEKKRNTSKKSPVKKNVKSDVKSSRKVVHNLEKSESKKESSWVQIVFSERNLKILFVLLIILVVVLLIMTVSRHREAQSTASDMVIPIIEDNVHFEFGINAKELSEAEDGEYVFKVTNYRNDSINKEDMTYMITIENETGCEISFTRDDGDDLMQEQVSTSIVDESLKGGNKEVVYYHVKYLSGKATNDTDLIKISVSN